MKYAFILIILLQMVNACGQSRSQAEFDNMLEKMYKKTVPLIYSNEVIEQNPESFVILDTREKEEYEVSHLDGAIWVGYDNLQTERIEELSKDKPVLVYCSVGYRSERVGKKLQDMGFQKVWNLYGGIFDWKNRDYEVINQAGKPTEKVHTYNRKWSQWLRKGEKVY